MLERGPHIVYKVINGVSIIFTPVFETPPIAMLKLNE